MAGGNTRCRRSNSGDDELQLPSAGGGINFTGLAAAQQNRLIDAIIAREAATQRKADAETSAINARTNQPPPVPPPNPSQQLEGENTLPPEALTATLLRPDLPRVEVGKIFLNTFNPKSLYKLSRAGGYNDNERDQNMVLDGDLVKVVKTTGTYKNFGRDPYIWSEGFLNYINILLHFHASRNVKLIAAVIQFHNRIIQLSKIYQWQDGVLILALTHHRDVCSTGVTDHSRWAIPQEKIHTHCNELTKKTVSHKRTATRDESPPSRKKRTLEPNDKT
ncbi:MAG: hypothetical protein MMC33_010840, partial [Icmadophila ericetorum]|nr:hypothetical protein [Icmadophila ericetorum]